MVPQTAILHYLRWMRGFLMVFICLASLVFALNSCRPDKYAAENDLISSYYAQFPDSGARVKATTSILEDKLVSYAIIPDTAVATYQYALKYILNNNSAPFEASLILAEELRPFLVNEPRLGLDSILLSDIAVRYPESRIASIVQGLTGRPHSDSSFLDNLMRGLTREDLQQPLYKNFALLYIAKMHEKKAASWNKEYAPSGNTVFIARSNTLTFVIDSAGNAWHNDDPINIEEVGRQTCLFMTQDSSKANWVIGRISLIGNQPINTGVIIIGVHPNAPNSQLLSIYEEINRVFTDKRKVAAETFFRKNYFLLDKNQRSALQLLTRKWISISELASPEN